MNIQHLMAMLNLINVASQRGAFRGEELNDIGTLYNAIKAEVQSLQEKENENGEVLD